MQMMKSGIQRKLYWILSSLILFQKLHSKNFIPVVDTNKIYSRRKGIPKSCPENIVFLCSTQWPVPSKISMSTEKMSPE